MDIDKAKAFIRELEKLCQKYSVDLHTASPYSKYVISDPYGDKGRIYGEAVVKTVDEPDQCILIQDSLFEENENEFSDGGN